MAKETSDSIFIGTDFQRVFHIKNDTELASIDITGWALSWMVKRYTSDADGSALLTKTTSAGIVIAGAFNASPSVNAQRATVTVVDTDSTSLNPGLYFWELKRTDDTFETVLAFGTIEVIQGVHR